MVTGRPARARSHYGPVSAWTFCHCVGNIQYSSLAASPTITEASSASRAVRDTRTWRKWRGSATFVSNAFAASRIGFQYSVDSGSTWKWLDGTAGTAPAASESPVCPGSGSVGTDYRTDEMDVPLEVQLSEATLFRVCAFGGNGATNVTWRSVALTVVLLSLYNRYSA